MPAVDLDRLVRPAARAAASRAASPCRPRRRAPARRACAAAPAGCAASAPGDLRRDVLHERAAAGDVQHLHAAADREDRQVARARRAHQRDLELVALRAPPRRPSGAALRRTATAPRRRRRSAAGRRGRRAPASIGIVGIEDARLAADVKDRLPVVFELPAGRDANDGHGLHSIRNVDAHQIERARELRAHVGDAGGAPPLPIRALLVEDRVPMIERVEGLRQPERVLGQDREFERSDDLLDDLVEA